MELCISVISQCLLRLEYFIKFFPIYVSLSECMGGQNIIDFYLVGRKSIKPITRVIQEYIQ